VNQAKVRPDRNGGLAAGVYTDRAAGAFLYQLVMTPTRWTMFWVRMIGAAAIG
jgi:hypothetical protein